MKIEHAVMRLKWMLFGVALLLGCVLFNQVTLLELVWLSLPVALVGFIMVLCNLILLGVETPKEKKKRMKQARKRYNKKMSTTRRKIAVQKGMQTVARLMGKQMDFKKKPSDKTEKKAYRKAGWHKSLFVPGAYTRKAK